MNRAVPVRSAQAMLRPAAFFFRRMTKLEIAAVVSGSKTRLRKMIPLVRDFLQEQLGLELNMDKVAIYSAYRGVEFLGASLKPFRIYG